MLTRTRRALLATIITTGALALADTASAAPPVAVDFTVRETLPLGDPGVVVAGAIPGCADPEVTTIPESVSTAGPVTRFTGMKEFDCGGGDSFTLYYDARVIGCAPSDFGRWKILGGTGSFADAKGQGRLVGTYLNGDGCDNDGIDDRYTGRIKLG